MDETKDQCNETLQNAMVGDESGELYSEHDTENNASGNDNKKYFVGKNECRKWVKDMLNTCSRMVT